MSCFPGTGAGDAVAPRCGVAVYESFAPAAWSSSTPCVIDLTNARYVSAVALRLKQPMGRLAAFVTTEPPSPEQLTAMSVAVQRMTRSEFEHASMVRWLSVGVLVLSVCVSSACQSAALLFCFPL